MDKKASIDLKRLGKILYKLRKKHDLIQDDLANFIGIKRASYSGVERGTFGPGPNFIISVVKFYKEKGELLTTDYLYGLEETVGAKLGDEERREMKHLKEENTRLLDENEKLKVELLEQKGLVKKLIDKL